MSTTKLVAIEGGGTRTRAWLVEGAPDAPRIEAQRLAGGSNFQKLGAAEFGALVRGLVEAVVSEAGARLDQVAAVGMGMAGVSGPDEEEAVRAALRERGLYHPVAVTSDARVALEGATAGGPGVLLIAGTGSIAMGVSADGLEARAGGWGHQLGDEGSGYALGRAWLRRATRVLDGRERDPQDRVLSGLLEFLGLTREDELRAWIRAKAPSPDAIAQIAQVAFAAAASGDGVARELVAEGADQLASMVYAVCAQLALPADVAVSLHGGCLTGNFGYAEAVTRAVRQRLVSARIERTPGDVAMRGCVRIAYRMLAGRKVA